MLLTVLLWLVVTAVGSALSLAFIDWFRTRRK